VENTETFIDEELQNPREEEDEDILEDFESKESSDDLFDGDFETEAKENFRIKNLDDQEDQNLEKEFQFFIEGEDIEESQTPVDEELQLEKEALESEVKTQKEISLKDENTTDESLVEEFEDNLENFDRKEMEIIEDGNIEMEFIGGGEAESKDNKETFGKEGFEDALEGLDEEDLEGLDSDDLEEIEIMEEEKPEEDLEKIEIIEEEKPEEDLEDMKNRGDIDNTELEEFEEIDVL